MEPKSHSLLDLYSVIWNRIPFEIWFKTPERAGEKVKWWTLARGHCWSNKGGGHFDQKTTFYSRYHTLPKLEPLSSCWDTFEIPQPPLSKTKERPASSYNCHYTQWSLESPSVHGLLSTLTWLAEVWYFFLGNEPNWYIFQHVTSVLQEPEEQIKNYVSHLVGEVSCICIKINESGCPSSKLQFFQGARISYPQCQRRKCFWSQWQCFKLLITFCLKMNNTGPIWFESLYYITLFHFGDYYFMISPLAQHLVLAQQASESLTMVKAFKSLSDPLRKVL